MSRLTLVGYVAGFWYALLSALRYFVIYPDPSQAIVNVLVGCLIIGFSWLYERSIKQEYELVAVGDYIADDIFKTKSKRKKK